MEKIAAIRIKGRVGVRKEIEDTLHLLRLRKKHACVVIPKNPCYEGMLKKVEDYVTWGEITFETFLKLLEKRGRLKGEKKLTPERIRELGFNSIEELAKAIWEGKKIEQLKPFFRLHPPKRGFKSIKHSYPKGDLGYRGKAINELIERMI